MPRGCIDNKNPDNKVLGLETMKNMSIDEIINMYRKGYILKDLEQGKQDLGQGGYGINYLDIKSLTITYPNIIDASGYADSSTGPTHEILLYSNSGTYGYVHLEAYTGTTVLAEIKECVPAFVTLYRLSIFPSIPDVQNNVMFRAKACDTTTGQDCTVTPPTCTSETIKSTFLVGVDARLRNTTLPATPTGLTIIPGDTQLTLTWNSVSDPDGSGEVFAYKVDVTATDFHAFGYRPSGIPGRTVTIWGLINGTTYNVSIKALTHSNVLGPAITGTGIPAIPCPTPEVSVICPTSPVSQGTVADIVATIITAGTPDYTYKLYVDDGTAPVDTSGPTANMSHAFSHIFSESGGPHTYKVEVVDSCTSGAKTVSNTCTATVAVCPIPIVSVTCPVSPINQGSIGSIVATIITAGTPDYTYKLYVDDGTAPVDTSGPTANMSHAFSHIFSESGGPHTYKVEVVDSCTISGPKIVSNTCTVNIRSVSGCTAPVVSVICPTTPVSQGTVADIVATITTVGTPDYTYKLYVDDGTAPVDTFGPTTNTSHTFSHIFSESVVTHTYKVEVTDSCPSGALSGMDICSTTVQKVPAAGAGGALVIAAVAALGLAYYMMRRPPT